MDIVLTNGKIAVVSDEDVAEVSGYNWYQGVNGYVYTKSQRNWVVKNILLHRLILERKIGRPLRHSELTDHINRDKLDNRRENLRVATKSQSNRNTGPRARGKSGYKGVSWHKGAGKWAASIYKGRYIHLGLYEVLEAAARAYDVAARELFGEFAYLNFGEVSDETSGDN